MHWGAYGRARPGWKTHLGDVVWVAVLVAAVLLAGWYLYEPPARDARLPPPAGPVLPSLSHAAGDLAPPPSPDRLRLEQERLDLLRRLQATESESLQSATDVRGNVLEQIRLLEARRAALLEEIARLGSEQPAARSPDPAPPATVAERAVPPAPAADIASAPAPDRGAAGVDPPGAGADTGATAAAEPEAPGVTAAPELAGAAPGTGEAAPRPAEPTLPPPGPAVAEAPPASPPAAAPAPVAAAPRPEPDAAAEDAESPAILPETGIAVAGRPASGILAEPLPAPGAVVASAVPVPAPAAAVPPLAEPLPVPPPAPPEGTALAALPPPPPARPPVSAPRARGDVPAENQAAIAAERRCRAIVVRAQLGEEPSDADKNFLRTGCRAR